MADKNKKLSKQNTLERSPEMCCHQDGFLCEDCTKVCDLPNINSSISAQKSKLEEEEKEEETECYYCLKSNQISREAILLYKGKASCLECKQSNFVNYIAAPDGKQRTIVTRRQESRQFTSPPTNSNQPLTTLPQMIKTHQSYQYPSSTKNATNPMQGGGFFPSKFGSHQKHQSEMIITKYDSNGNPIINNQNNGFSSPYNNQPFQMNPSDGSPSQNQYIHYFNQEQQQQQQYQFGVEQNSVDNTPKHQKNSQTDPFVGRNFNTSKDGIFQSAVDNSSLTKSYIPIPNSPQIMFKDPKIETILKEMLSKGQSYIQKKAVMSLVENRKNFTSQKFHDKLDKKKQILYVIILKSGFIFGGFHYVSLKSQKDKSIDDQHSGLFSMQGSDINFYPVENSKIIYFDNGVWFGKPPCLIINFDMIDKCFCNKEFIFLSPLGESQTIQFGPATKWNQIIQDICILQF